MPVTDKRFKILVAEDEFIIAMDIKRILEELGYEVVAFVNNGKDIIEHIEKDRPDLILMDIMLNGPMSGIETAHIVRQKYNLPVVYLTALTDEATLQKAKLTEPVGYVLKPFDSRSLHSSIEIAIYKHSIETQLKIKTNELEEEKNKTDELLHHILPDEIIRELKLYNNVSPRLYKNITILFTDFHGFSDIINTLQPGELVNELNIIFSTFDDIIESFGLEKLKTLGDTYMIGGGFPKESSDHAIKVILAAKQMLKFMDEKNLSSKVQWKMRVGVNSGPVVAGIVGTNKFNYDVWGDTVNIASRIEGKSEAGKINISGTTYEFIKDFFECEYRGKLNVKGKGGTDMYFVLDKKLN